MKAAATQSSVLAEILMLVAIGGASAAWIWVSAVLPKRRRRRQRWVIERARAEALVDADFSDRAVIEACQVDIQRLQGDHRLADRDVPVQELLGIGAFNWLLVSAATRGLYRIQLATCDVIRVLDRGEEGLRRVVVCVTMNLSIPRQLMGGRRSAVVYWTMTERDSHWERIAVEDEWAGRRHLQHDPLAAPDADVDRLHDRAVLESSGEHPAPIELVQPVGDVVGPQRADAALRELALVDGRYDRSVIESCVRRLLAAWETATNGDPSALDDVTELNAKQQLLHHDRWLPTTIREPRLTRLTVVEFDAKGDRPTVTVLARLRAEPDIRSLEVYWMLALVGNERGPWVLRDAKAWKDAYLFVE